MQQFDTYVLYVPNHANGNLSHRDVERCVVSSKNANFLFLKNADEVERRGWDNTPSKAASRQNVVTLCGSPAD